MVPQLPLAPSYGDRRRQGRTDGRYWQYYVNGVYMGTGADLTGVKDGDVVRWEFRSALQ